MNVSDFEFLRSMIAQKAGIAVNPDKSYMVESRLMPVARQFKHDDIASLVIALRGLADPKLESAVISAVTFSDTYFHRDVKAFRALEDKVLPALAASRGLMKKLRVWAAACSMGQEAYSVAMAARAKGLNAPQWNVSILGTDINPDVVARAERGSYTQYEIQRGLPVRCLVTWFDQVEDRWNIKGELRKQVSFKQFNLMQSSDSFGSFDLILLRNVLPYFEDKARIDVVNKIVARLPKDGVLMLGANETLPDTVKGLVPLGDLPGFFTPTGSPLLKKI